MDLQQYKKMTVGYIYKIHFPNEKHYIGLTTTSIKQRTREHKKSAKNGDTRCVYNAIRKYEMVDTLELIVIDTADTLEELCEKEIRYIIEYNSYYINKNGYNMTCGGEGFNGYIYTEEDNKKNSERRIRYYEEHPEAGKEHSEKLKKHYENPEAIVKMSEVAKKYYENPEARQKCSQSQKKRFENPEEIQKLCIAQQKRYEDPQAGKEHSERLKKYYNENPEARKKLSDGKGKNKPFDLFKDGTFIKTFSYQFEAIEYLQKEHNIITTIKISAVLKGSRKSSAGFVFKYK